MSLPVPLVVRLRTSLADRVVTRDLRSLRFRSVAPGGYASCSIALDRPLTLQPQEIGYFGQLTVYDARSGAVVWDGRVEDPGRGASPDGLVWDVNAIGGRAHASDVTLPVTYAETDLSRLEPVDSTYATDGQVRTGEDQTVFIGEPSMILAFPNGTPVTSNSFLPRGYLQLARNGQKLARVDFKWDSGRTDANLRLETHARDYATWTTTFTKIRDDACTTTGGGLSPKLVGTDWTAGKDSFDIRLHWTDGSATVADDVTWAAVAGLVVQGTRYDKTGTELLTAASYASNTILASDIVADVLGRMLPKYDGTNASIATTSYGIDKLGYPDGATAEKILSDLMVLEPGYFWAVWESNSAGLYRFVWRAWPTTVRYVASTVDGLDSPGSAADLYNAVRVRYRDSGGQVKTIRRTSSVPVLTTAGLTREGYIDLGDEVGSLANAQQAGDKFLMEHGYAPNAGRLTVARPIQDLYTGRMVQPWEIVPGNLIRVSGILPRVDALNATARDGVTVFRLAAVDYDAGRASAELELDSYPISTAQQRASAARSPLIRRR